MWLNVLMFLAIIVLSLYSATLCYSFYSSAKLNHYRFRHLYQFSILIIFESVLAIYSLITSDTTVNEIRWMAFSFAELSIFYFILKSYSNRHFELIIGSVYIIILLISSLLLNVWLNILLVLILIMLSLMSKDKILKSHFSCSFALYGCTSVVPSVFGFTQFESILMGLIFTLHFTLGIRKLYVHEKTDDELKRMLLNNEI